MKFSYHRQSSSIPFMGERKKMNLQDAKELDCHPVKRLYLSVIAVILRSIAKVMVSHESGTLLRVDGSKVDVQTVVKYALANYIPTMHVSDYSDKTPAYMLIGRNMAVTVDGNTRKDSENTASVRDRQRIGNKGSKNYRYNPNRLTIHGVDVKDTNGRVNTTWTIKDASGKTLTTCRVLNAEAWPFCESYQPKK